MRTSLDDNVIIYTLGPSHREPPENDFIPTPNAAVVGGVPSDIAFVNTNQGPRLAVVVPSPAPTGFLIKVDDSQTLSAKFAAGYQRLTPVAGFASETNGLGDQVLLWSTDSRTSSIAFWDLDKVPDMPSGSSIDTLKSIQTLNLNGTVASVVSIPQSHRKIVETSSRALYVLDPQLHLTSALNTTGKVVLRYSREGDRAWAFEPSQSAVAQIALAGPHIRTVDVDRPVADVVEIESSDGGRALLALHTVGGAGVSRWHGRSSSRRIHRGDGFRRAFAGYRRKSSLRSGAAGKARPMRNPFRSSGGSTSRGSHLSVALFAGALLGLLSVARPAHADPIYPGGEGQADPQVRNSFWQGQVGMRSTFVTDPGFDPFATDNALTTFSARRVTHHPESRRVLPGARDLLGLRRAQRHRARATPRASPPTAWGSRSKVGITLPHGFMGSFA